MNEDTNDDNANGFVMRKAIAAEHKHTAHKTTLCDTITCFHFSICVLDKMVRGVAIAVTTHLTRLFMQIILQSDETEQV